MCEKEPCGHQGQTRGRTSAPNLQPLEGTKVEMLFPLETMEYPMLEQVDFF